jgi:hypothetical protein
MSMVSCARLRIASVLAVSVLLLLAPGRSQAASLPFVIDLSFPFDPVPGSSLSVQGTFLEAASFQVDSSLLRARRINFVPFNRLDAFTLGLPVLSLSPGEVRAGTCGTGVRPPCGILFVGTRPLTLVGAFNAPSASGAFSFGLANTGMSGFNPDPRFQTATIFDSAARVVVASGFATIRPVPEPSSLLLLLAGGLAVRRAVRNRHRRGGAA